MLSNSSGNSTGTSSPLSTAAFHSPTVGGDSRSRSVFHEFNNVEDEEGADLLNASPTARPHWWQRNRAPYILDLLNCQLSLANIWRFPAIALAMSIQWQDDSMGLLNYLVPYVIALILIGWPLLIGEMAVSQITSGSGPRAFGSLGPHSRAAGLSWLMSIFLCLIMAALSSYSLMFAIKAPAHKANYFTTRISTSANANRTCTAYGTYLPDIQPLLCLQHGRRLDVSCFDEDNCQLWAGVGRCIAVPWGPAASLKLSNADQVDPLMDNDYPQYCAARFFHDVVSNEAPAVMSADAYWRDYGSSFAWHLGLAFIFVWGCAAAMSLAGRRLSMLIRFCVGTYGLSILMITLFCAIHWFRVNNWSNTSWLKPLYRFQVGAIARPDIWAAAVVQVVLALGIGTNHLMAKTGAAPSEKYNVVWIATMVVTFSAVISCISLVLVFLAYGAATSQDIKVFADDAILATIRYDIRNMPLAQLFTSLQTMFDNSPSLDGTTPRPWILSMGFWIGITALGINCLHNHIEAIVAPMHKSAANWSLGLGRWLLLLIVVLTSVLMTVILWWGCSWGLVVLLQHFFLNFALPLVALYEAIAIGWLHGWEARAKHFGSWPIWVQLGGYLAGCVIACVTTAAHTQSRNMTARWIGLFIGLVIMLISIIVPVFLQKHWDAYGRRHGITDKAHNMVYSSVNHLKKEINVRSCHTASVMRLTFLWALLLKYVVPFGLILAWSVFIVRSEQHWAFSPYRPYYNDQDDVFSHVEKALEAHGFLKAPALFVGLVWCLAFIVIIAMLVMFFLPHRLEWMMPPDTDPNFFDVKKALELFAHSTAQSQIPVRLRDRDETTASPTNVSMPNWKEEADKLSTMTPSNTIRIAPRSSPTQTFNLARDSPKTPNLTGDDDDSSFLSNNSS